MTGIDITQHAPDLSGFADKQPEVAWTGFMVVTLDLLHALREKARSMSKMLAPTSDDGPEQAADALLDHLYKMAGQATFEPGLAEVTIDGIQMALYRNITVPGRWGSWTALQAAMQEAAEEVALTVASIADEYVEILANLEALKNPDEADRTSIAPMRNVIAILRALVEQVRQAGAMAQA